MIKKKLSGQTITIIVLTILLVLTIGFGGVYAYQTARSKKVSGKIIMANLKIEMGCGDKSVTVISNASNIVPGQPLENSPLTIENKSLIDVYLIVVYEMKTEKIKAEDDDSEREYIEDEFKTPVIDIGVQYINSLNNDYNSSSRVSNTGWIDYVFKGNNENEYYRCLVSTKPHGETKEGDAPITVIEEDKMSISGYVGNNYQGTNIELTFQAYAIGSETNLGITDDSGAQEKCQAIVSAIYFSQGNTFLFL